MAELIKGRIRKLKEEDKWWLKYSDKLDDNDEKEGFSMKGMAPLSSKLERRTSGCDTVGREEKDDIRGGKIWKRCMKLE